MNRRSFLKKTGALLGLLFVPSNAGAVTPTLKTKATKHVTVAGRILDPAQKLALAATRTKEKLAAETFNASFSSPLDSPHFVNLLGDRLQDVFEKEYK